MAADGLWGARCPRRGALALCALCLGNAQLVLVRLQLLERLGSDQHGRLEHPLPVVRADGRREPPPQTPALLRLVANLGVNRSESKALAVQPGRDLGSRQSTAELRHDGGEYHLGVLQLTVLLRELGGSKSAFAQARGRLLMRQGPRFAELLRRFGSDPRARVT